MAAAGLSFRALSQRLAVSQRFEWFTRTGFADAGRRRLLCIGKNRRMKTFLKVFRAFGFRRCDLLELALFHTMGELPEPELTRRFC